MKDLCQVFTLNGLNDSSVSSPESSLLSLDLLDLALLLHLLQVGILQMFVQMLFLVAWVHALFQSSVLDVEFFCLEKIKQPPIPSSLSMLLKVS